MSDFFSDADIVYGYTTDEAIADGTLVDVDKDPALKNIGRRYIKPDRRLVITSNLRGLLVEDAGEDPARLSEVWGRIMATFVAQALVIKDYFLTLDVEIKGEKRRLFVTCGAWGTDDPTPKITFMLPEDY